MKDLFDIEPSGRKPIEVSQEYFETHWESKDGRVTKIADLDDMHLFNIIKMLWLNKKKIAEYMREDAMSWGEPQGEMAQDAFWSEIDNLYKMDDEKALELQIPQWKNLINEAQARNINWKELIEQNSIDYSPFPQYRRASEINTGSKKSKKLAQSNKPNREKRN